MLKYFTVGEMTHSHTARLKNIDNRIPRPALPHVLRLITQVLDPLREAYGKPIRVNSGYRCPRLNQAVGGAEGSHHLRGMAADITGTPATREENRRLFLLVQELGLPFTQLIDEKGGRWVHVSLDPDDVRREVLVL